MSVAYVDTSLIAAVLLEETGFQGARASLRKFDGLYSSNLLEAELVSMLARERVEMSAAGPALSALHWVLPDRPLSPELERIGAKGRLRGADLWHLACALFLSPEPGELHFLTLDGDQKRVARSMGFRLS